VIKISENSETINTPSSEQPSITVDSYDEMSEKLEAQTQGRKNVRIFLTVFALIFLIYIVFYLTLPIFQAKSM
jgi:sugar phosphate permease